ncbi:MAG: phosphatase [Oscillospiraceae bacterium]|jgi:putative hydrolase|nr:phosphatase [Oscillospiraceae bacterium]
MLIQADLHCHSLASSHAYSTVDEMAAAARRYGLKAFALTDHAMSMPDAPHEWHFHNLHVLPQKINGVTVLRGAEANIKSFEGDIDMTEFDLSNLQWVVASCHVPVIKPGTEKENTAAYVNAVKNNTAIDVIGHCTVFRYPVDFEAIAKACKEYGKFIELNESSFQYRRSTEENCIAMLRACKKYETEITVNTDCHYAGLIGQTPLTEKILESVDFPEKLIFNRDADKVLEYVSKKHNIILKK